MMGGKYQLNKPFRTVKEVNHVTVYERIRFLAEQSNHPFEGWPKAIFLHHTHGSIDFDAKLIDIDERVKFRFDDLPYGIVETTDGRFIPFTESGADTFYNRCGVKNANANPPRTFLVKEASTYYLWIQAPSFFKLESPTLDGKVTTFRMSPNVDNVIGFQISKEDVRMMGWSL